MTDKKTFDIIQTKKVAEYYKKGARTKMLKSLFIIVRNGEIKQFTMWPHCHNCFELVYYCDCFGKSNYEKQSDVKYDGINKNFTTYNMQNDSVFNFKPNSYIIYPPNTLHNEVQERWLSTDTHLVAIGFEADELLDSSSDVIFGDDPNLVIFELIEKIRKEYIAKSNDYSQMINAYLAETIIKIKRKINERQHIPNIDYIKNYLDEYFMNDIDLNALAKDMSYTPEHFRLLFKKHFGTSPKNYVIQKRMDFAKTLITSSDLQLTEIAERCGYWNYKHFSAYFIKMVGVSPHAYRNANSNQQKPQS